MRLKRRLKPDLYLNLTPLIDVLLLVLIFFLLATVFRVGPGIPLNLPQSSSAGNVSLTELHVTVISESEVYLDKDRSTLAGLDSLVKKRTEGKDLKKLRVVVEGGHDAPYQLVVSVLDVLRKNKVEGVNLMTRLAEKSS